MLQILNKPSINHYNTALLVNLRDVLQLTNYFIGRVTLFFVNNYLTEHRITIALLLVVNCKFDIIIDRTLSTLCNYMT